MLPREVVADGPHLLLCTREGYARPELPHRLVRVIVAEGGWVEREGHPEVGLAGIAKSRRCDADDLKGTAVEGERLSERGLRAAELHHGPVVCDDSDTARPPILLCQQASCG